jgi:hypothetical protein
MNNSVKILLTISILGVVGKPQSNLEIIPFSYNTDTEGKPINEVRGTARHRNKEVKPYTQHIKMSQDAYDYYISSEVPYWSDEHTWKRLSKNERIAAHCARIANGNKFNFQILE